jgi:hypothetical protein
MAEQPESEKQAAAASDDISRLAAFAERLRINDYLELLQRPRRLVWVGFLSGLGRGAGAAIGGLIVIVLLGLLLSHVVNMPMVGKYLARLVHEVNRHLPR